jgi:autotransporter translocation and assembly factor TamB
MVRKVLIIGGSLALVLALLTYAFLAGLFLTSARQAAVRAGLDYVSGRLQGSVEIGAVQGSFLSAPVLRDVVLKDAQGAVIGHIEEIRLAYDLLDLARLRLTVRAVDIIKPRLTIVEGPDGVLNLSRALQPIEPRPAGRRDRPTSDGGPPVALSVEELRVRAGDIRLGLPALPGVQQVSDVQARVQARIDQQGLQARVHELSARTAPAQVDLHTLQGAFQRLGGVMRVDGLRLELGHTVLTAEGTLPSRQQAADFALRVDPLALDEIGRLLRHDALHHGLRLAATIAGPPQALQFNVRIDPTQENARGTITLQGELDTAASLPRYRADLDITHLDLSAVLAKAAWQSDLNLQARLAGEGLAARELQTTAEIDIARSHLGNILLQPSAIDLQARQGRFQIQRFDVKTSLANVQARGTIDLAGRSDVQYELTATLDSLRQLLNQEPLNGRLRLQGQASGDWPDLRARGELDVREVRYQKHALDSLRLIYEGSQLGAQPEVTANVVLRQARLGEFPVESVTVTGKYSGSARRLGFEASVEQSADLTLATHGSLTLPEQGQRIDIEAIRLQLADRLWQSAAPVQIVNEPGRLHFTPLRLVHAEESLEIAGGLSGEQLQDIRVQMTQIDLVPLQRFLEVAEPTNGRVNLQAHLTGTLAQPRLQTDLALQPERPGGLPFRQLQAALAYAERHLSGGVHLHQGERETLAVDVQLPIDLAFTDLTPAQRLVDGAIAVEMRLERPDLGAFSRWHRALPQLAGTLHGALNAQGTYAQLDLKSGLTLEDLSVEGVVERVNGPIELAAHVVAAPSVADMPQAMQRGELTLTVDPLTLHIPLLQGQLPAQAQGQPPQPFELRDVTLRAAGEQNPQGLQATLQTLRLQARAFGMPRTDVLMSGEVTPQRLELKQLQVRLPQSEIRGRGHVTMADQQLQFRLDIPNLHLDDLPFALPPDLPRLVQGQIAANGSLIAPRLEARLAYAGARLDAEVEAQLREEPPTYRAALHIDSLDVARLAPNLAGVVQARVQLHGAGFTPVQRRATVNMAVDSTNLNVAPGLTLRLQSSLAGDALDIQTLRVTSAPMQLTAGGTLSAAPGSGVGYTLTLGDLTPLQPLVGAPLQATGTLTGSIRGALDALQTQGTLRLTSWRYAEASGAAIEGDFSASQLPHAPQGQLKLDIADVQAPSLPATSLRLEANYAPPQGRLSASVIKGPYQRTALAGRIMVNGGQRLTFERFRLQHQELVWANDGPVEIVRSPQGDIDIQRFHLRSGAQRLSVAGNLGQAGALNATVRLQQIQIGPTVRLVNPDAAVPEGQLSMDLSLSGTLQQPQGQGSLQLTSLAWQERKLGEVRASIALAEQRARTDLRWTLQGRELLRVQGSAGLAADGALALQARAPGIDLALLKGMVPQITDSAGRLSLDLQVDGTLQQPQVNGSILLNDGVLQLVPTGERYRDIQVQVIMAGDRIDIQRLHVGSRSGPLDATGRVTIDGATLRQVDLTIQARDFTAMHTAFIQAQTSMDLTVRGSMQEMTASGAVTVSRLRAQINHIPGTGPKEVQPWELTVAGVYGPGPDAVGAGPNGNQQALQVDVPLPFLRADIRVDIPRNAWIQGPGTAVEFSGDLRLTKALQQPFILSGGISLDRGFATVFGKKFVVKQGQVTFPGSPEINPFLDVTVTHTVSNYLVEIHVDGQARQPQVTFSSTPELEQSDILALLIVGKTMDRLTSSDQQNLSSQLGGAAGGLLAGKLQDVIGGALGLDTLTIGAGESFGGGSVSIGQYVTQDIFMSYEVGMGKGGGSRVGIEYSITPELKLKGSTSDSGASAVDFLWRRDY